VLGLTQIAECGVAELCGVDVLGSLEVDGKNDHHGEEGGQTNQN
jgi:hypothetical protein